MPTELYLEHPFVVAMPFLDTEYVCSRCAARFSDGDVPEGRCLSCDSDALVEDGVAAIEANDDGDTKVRLIIRQSEAPEFFEQLDRALRVNFGIRLAAVGGCDDSVRLKIGWDEGEAVRA